MWPNNLREIKNKLDQMEKCMMKHQSEVLERFQKLESMLIQPQLPQVETNVRPNFHLQQTPTTRRPLADLNSAVTSASNSSDDINLKVQAVLAQTFARGVQLGMALAKAIFSNQEMALCTLTGRTVHGQTRAVLNTTKIKLIEDLIKQRFNQTEAEYAYTQSAFRSALMNRCKYLRLKLAPQNQEFI